jgi:molybdopterin molybdotransferase
MIDLQRARELLFREVRSLGDETVPVDRSFGRLLRQAVLADRDFPPTDRSAMDGYAVRSSDLRSGERELEVIGESRAGSPDAQLRVGAGQAVRIMTGGVVPPGADAVVMVERTREKGSRGRVSVDDQPEPGQHIRPRGEDLRQGETAIEAGVEIGAPELAAFAAVGASEVRVSRLPEVGVLATGDEIVEPDQNPLPHQLRNSNSPALLAQLRAMGLEGRYLGIANDRREDLRARIARGLAGDCLLISGGVSVGEYDLVGSVLAEQGLRLFFHKVSIKPGKPVLAGRCGDCLVLGLPGNPVSTFVAFLLFAAPALRRMMGYRQWDDAQLTAELERPLRAKPGRQTFHLARLRAEQGKLKARLAGSRGSGDVLSLIRANGLLITGAEGADLPVGARLPALLWRDFHLRGVD